MKILFVMLNPDYIRNYASTIMLLADRGHHVLIGFNTLKERTREEPEKQLSKENARISCIDGQLPKGSGVRTKLLTATRSVRDYIRYLYPNYAHAYGLRERVESILVFSSSMVKFFRIFPKNTGLKFLDRCLGKIEEVIPADNDIIDFLQSEKPDIILITPLVGFFPVQKEYVKAARYLGIKCGACIHSWDNLTNKGLMQLEPDKVMVWNNAQKIEAIKLHGVSPDKIVVTGAQCYDKWFERRSATLRNEFHKEVGLRQDRPFILYLCSSNFIAPREVDFIREWIKCVRSASDEYIRNAGILVRPHFQNARQWENVDFGNLGNVVIWPKAGENPVSEESKNHFYDSLYHSSAVIGINTSAMIEAGILGKPVFTILDSRFSRTQEGTLHFRHLVDGGLLFISHDFREHIEQMRDVLCGTEDKYKDKIKHFIHEFVRPYGMDIACTPLLADAIENLSYDRGHADRRPRLLYAS